MGKIRRFIRNHEGYIQLFMGLIALLGICLFLYGCATSPLESDVADIDGPAVLNAGGFEKTTDQLTDTGKLWAWVKQNARYKSGTNWGDESDPDEPRRLAQSLYANRGGACMQFAGFHVYCARKSGHKCGAILTYNHIIAFTVEHNGKITISDNGVFSPSGSEPASFVQTYADKARYTWVDQHFIPIEGDYLKWLQN
jgi:hypothetical protein